MYLRVGDIVVAPNDAFLEALKIRGVAYAEKSAPRFVTSMNPSGAYYEVVEAKK